MGFENRYYWYMLEVLLTSLMVWKEKKNLFLKNIDEITYLDSCLFDFLVFKNV